MLRRAAKHQFLDYVRRVHPEMEMHESWMDIEVTDRAEFGAQFHLVYEEEPRIAMAQFSISDSGCSFVTRAVEAFTPPIIRLWNTGRSQKTPSPWGHN